MARLTDKQKRFIEYYLQCWNATEAARLAGYRDPNTLGPRTRQHPTVDAEIRARLSKLAMQSDEILARLAHIARGGFLDILDDDNIPSLDAARRNGALSLVKRYRSSDRGTTIELYDALAALKLIGENQGMWKTVIQGDPDRPIFPLRQIVAALQEAQNAGTNTPAT